MIWRTSLRLTPHLFRSPDARLPGPLSPIRLPVSVWSWDASRLLVGEGSDDLRIVTRTEWAE